MEPGTDNAFALVTPYVNTEAMQVFLDRFAATIGDDEHVAMVLDQAGWHGSRALRTPDNITLVPLPPYSPELNPVERVWLHLKERFLSHRLLADDGAIDDLNGGENDDFARADDDDVSTLIEEIATV